MASPQGTILGPVLFIEYYIDSILRLSSSGNITSFEDDTAVFYQAETWCQLERKVVDDLPEIIDCFQEKLTINCKNTWYVPFSYSVVNVPSSECLSIKILY